MEVSKSLPIPLTIRPIIIRAAMKDEAKIIVLTSVSRADSRGRSGHDCRADNNRLLASKFVVDRDGEYSTDEAANSSSVNASQMRTS